MNGVDSELVNEARELLGRAGGVVVLTGAGISADSGLATFRSADGWWKNHRPEDLATPQAFARDPRLVWEWYGLRRAAATESSPNAAHLSLARWAIDRDDVTIVTQNVDGLHTRAAESAAQNLGRQDLAGARPLELHGCLFRVRCTACEKRAAHHDPIDATSLETLPTCGSCGRMVRPDVIWFGEPLGPEIGQAFTLAQEAELCLVVGTSAVVQPAASIATVVRQGGGQVIEVNPEPTPLTPLAAVSFRAGAADMVPQLLD